MAALSDENKGEVKVSGATQAEEDPRLPLVEELDADALQDSINLLRRFHLGEPGASASTQSPDQTYLPLLLNGFRNLRRFRYEYPLLLLPDTSGELLARPLDEFLQGVLPEAEGSARMLKDNITWLETYIRDQISGQDFSTLARGLAVGAGEALVMQLGLKESDQEVLRADLDELVDNIPQGSHFLPYTHNVALHLLQHTIRHRTQWQREQMMRRIGRAVRGLQQLVEVEAEKTSDGKIIGEGSKFFDSSFMANVVENKSSGTLLMSSERMERIQATLDILTSFELDQSILHLVVRPRSFSIGDAGSINIVESADPCTKALELYDLVAGKLSRVFASLRTAELDVAGAYDSRFHDSWFESFSAAAFSDDERQMISTVVALETAEHATDDCMQSFSTVLASGKPVQILLNIDPHTNPGRESDFLGGLRMELAYLGIGHRHAVINQMSAAKYETLLSGFSAALGSHQACLHLIDTGFSDPQPLHPWIMATAALESRAHPSIKFDPTSTVDTEEMTFAGNPSPEDDWVMNTAIYRDEKGESVEQEVEFTFADYCLLKPDLLDHFRVIPDGYDSKDIVSVGACLNASADEQDRIIPFIWSVDGNGLIQKLVVSRQLLFSCRDRLDFWQTVQSLSGVKNAFVDEAVKKAREEEQLRAASEREELVREYEETIEQARTESANEVMGRLTNALMELDLTLDSPVLTASPRQAEAPAVTPVVEEVESEEVSAPEPAAEEDDDEISFDEPWIDSIFCTTCDDCLNLNKQMFVYNDNRQAIIADTKAGTFSQLVEAAELCPARCIHPGKPLDSSEGGLEDLIKRAEPFN